MLANTRIGPTATPRLGILLAAVLACSGSPGTLPAQRPPREQAPAPTVEELRRQLAVAAEQHGRPSLEWAQTAEALGRTLLIDHNQHAAAAPLLRETLDYYKAEGQSDSLPYLRCLHMLAQIEDRQENFRASLPLWEQVVELAATAIPDAGPRVAMLMGLSLAQERNQQPKAAIASLETAYGLQEKVGLASPNATFLLRKISMLHRLGLRQNAAAIRWQRKCLDLHATLKTNKTEEYLVDLRLWGHYHRGIDAAESVKTFRHVTDLAAQLHSPGSPPHLEDLEMLADIATETGDLRLGIATLEACVAWRSRQQPPNQQALQQLTTKLSGLQKRAGVKPVATPPASASPPSTPPAETATETATATETETETLAEIERLWEEVKRLRDANESAAAGEVVRRIVVLEEKRAGADQEKFAAAMLRIAQMEFSGGDPAYCETLLQRSLEIRRQVHGPDHPLCGQCYLNLGILRRTQGRRLEARDDFSAALRRAVVEGAKTPEYFEALSSLGAVVSELGDIARARQMLEEARVAQEGLAGDARVRLAVTLQSLALLSLQVGDWEAGERYLQRASRIAATVQGEKSLLHNISRLLLALALLQRDDLGQAGPIFDELLNDSSLKQAQPIAHAGLLSAAAMLRQRQNRPQEAQQLALQAVEVFRGLKQTGSMAQTQLMLGELQRLNSEGEAALTTFNTALEELKSVEDEYGERLAVPLSRIGGLQLAAGEADHAKAAYVRALDIYTRQLRSAFRGLAERQQLVMLSQLRSCLDEYLSLSNVSAEEAYRQALRWKGFAFAGQRGLRATRSPESIRILTGIQEISRQIAAVAADNPAGDSALALRERLTELTDRREQLEAELAAAAPEIHLNEITIEQIQEAIPEGAVFLDFLEYDRAVPAADRVRLVTKPQVALFVVRRGRPVQRIELGASAALFDAVGRWRELTVGEPSRDAPSSPSRTDGAEDPAEDPDLALRRMLWDPIADSVLESRAVFYSPDGQLGRFPLAALRTTEGRYLLELLPVAVIPIPALLPEVLRDPPADRERARAATATASLLLVGEIDYDAFPGPRAERATQVTNVSASPAAPRSDVSETFAPLALGGRELATVRGAWESHRSPDQVTALRGADATEEFLRLYIPQATHLHFCTHGYFDPANVRSALGRSRRLGMSTPLLSTDAAGWHPGLLSGLAVSGANRKASAEGGLTDDGRLTAMEVANLDLRNVDLVVLSACQTGLGRVVSGEGMLGLQRAFQVGGAQTVVASLWAVQDQPTQQIMDAFYRNHLQRGLGKLESLRQAQLSLLKGGAERTPLPPAAWAAWVLSGDPGDLTAAAPAAALAKVAAESNGQGGRAAKQPINWMRVAAWSSLLAGAALSCWLLWPLFRPPSDPTSGPAPQAPAAPRDDASKE